MDNLEYNKKLKKTLGLPDRIQLKILKKVIPFLPTSKLWGIVGILEKYPEDDYGRTVLLPIAVKELEKRTDLKIGIVNTNQK
jgi:hypothetical protein